MMTSGKTDATQPRVPNERGIVVDESMEDLPLELEEPKIDAAHSSDI